MFGSKLLVLVQMAVSYAVVHATSHNNHPCRPISLLNKKVLAIMADTSDDWMVWGSAHEEARGTVLGVLDSWAVLEVEVTWCQKSTIKVQAVPVYGCESTR